MFKFWSYFQKYLAFRHIAFLLALLTMGQAFGQTTPKRAPKNRAPASYVPDDDVIVKPILNELSFYQQYLEADKSGDVVKARNQIKVWNDNQNFANQYGMDSTLAGSPFFVPTADEKWQYFKDKYFRYLQRRGEQPLKDMPKNWYQEYRASNEVDTIDELEARFRRTSGAGTSERNLPNSLKTKEVSVWKKTSFIFQPRVDQGLVIVGIKSPIAYARAWVGVNGETEVNVQQSVNSIGLRVMFNYYASTGKYFTSVDQRLIENVYARVTTNKTPDNDPSTPSHDETLMLLYAKQF